MSRYQVLGGCFRLAVVLALAWTGPAKAQAVQEIPVYPGAALVVEKEDGASAVCCSFATRDAYEKVLAFYEGRLERKALDLKALAARYPVMRPQLQQMERQMPAGMRYRAFVLAETGPAGAGGAELFEVLSTPMGVTFNVTREQLGAAGGKFARDWGERTGQLTPEERAEKQREAADRQAAREADEDAKQAEEEARQAKKRNEAQQAARGRRVLAALEKELPRNDVRLYPSARQGVFLEACAGAGTCSLEFRYASPDDFQKVYEFYAAQLAAVPFPHVDAKGNAAMVTQMNRNGERERLAVSGKEIHAWRFAQFESKKCRAGVVLREVSETRGGPRTVYLSFEFVAAGAPKGCAGFNETNKEIES